MFTKDLAIFGTCAAMIRNRPDGGHEELILTAFVISLSLLLSFSCLFPPHLSFALYFFLSLSSPPPSFPDSFSDLHYEDYAFMNTFAHPHSTRDGSAEAIY